MIKRLERLKNTVNKYMADLWPTSQNGSCRKATTRCILKSECSNYKIQRKGIPPSDDIKGTNMNLGGYKQKILKLESD
jgi:hypothetical protein